jgi:nitrite reductase/ring-hydroxylating ferredoxin subunit
MKRADALVALSRRHFCGGVAGCVGVAALASCIDGSSTVIQTGPLGGSEGSNHDGVDAGMRLDSGSSTGTDAGSGAATCPTTGVTDAGEPSTFVTDKPVYFSSGNFFVVRDSGGLYALTARCTHEGATITAETSDFYCPRHGATFDFDGNVLGGPVYTGLVHYEMCTMSNGHVGVVTSKTVSQSERLNA